MGMEYSVKFDDPTWYKQHRGRLQQEIANLSSFVKTNIEGSEYWLKSIDSKNSYFDVRVFFRTETLFVEVTSFSKAFHRDLAAFLARLRNETGAVLVDDDGTELQLRDICR